MPKGIERGRNSQPLLAALQPGAITTPTTTIATCAAATCAAATDTDTDTDGDSLTDPVECFKLGALPDDPDTDDDSIIDGLKVAGFQGANGVWWYLDPINPDSNGDSLPDSLECPALTGISAITNTTTIYQDIDGDGTPDVYDYDYDDDGDGVPDSTDSSPHYTGGLTSNSQGQFNLSLNGYATGTPRLLTVNFEIRPTTYEHLYYTNNVLDWPDGDKEGQVTRVYTNTFYDTGAIGARTNYGDMMTTPLLEIEIPAPTANASNPSGGLPVKSSFVGGASAITSTTPITAWVDQDILDEYNISVSQANNGKLYAHVPLLQLKDRVGDTPVAWAGQMAYWPGSASWGGNHQVRLVWMVTALLDSCDTSEKPANFTNEAWCANLSYTKSPTEKKAIKTYYEDFYLTGMAVREDYGLDLAIMAQNNALSTDYENYLWHLSNGLQVTFGAGQQVANNRRFDSTSTASTTERWGLPANTFSIARGSYANQAAGLTDMVKNLIPNILTTTYASATSGMSVTLLMAREETYKSTLLRNNNTDFIYDQGTATLAVTLGSLVEQTFSTLHWAPYEYNSANMNQYNSHGWAAYDFFQYQDALTGKLNKAIDSSKVTSLLALFGEGVSDAPGAKVGAISLAKNYYTALYQGGTALVEDPNLGGIVNTELVEDDALQLQASDEAVLLIVASAVYLMQVFFIDQGEPLLDKADEILVTIGAVQQDLDNKDSATGTRVIQGVGSAAKKGLTRICVRKVDFSKTPSYGVVLYDNNAGRKLSAGSAITWSGMIVGTTSLILDLTGSKTEVWTYAIQAADIAIAGLKFADTLKTTIEFSKALKGFSKLDTIVKSAQTVNDIRKASRVGAAVGLALGDCSKITWYFASKITQRIQRCF